jgi:hypothetical protein
VQQAAIGAEHDDHGLKSNTRAMLWRCCLLLGSACCLLLAAVISSESKASHNACTATRDPSAGSRMCCTEGLRSCARRPLHPKPAAGRGLVRCVCRPSRFLDGGRAPPLSPGQPRSTAAIHCLACHLLWAVAGGRPADVRGVHAPVRWASPPRRCGLPMLLQPGSRGCRGP